MSDELWITRCPVPTASSVAFDRGMLEAALGPAGVAVRSLQDAPDPELRDAHFHHRLAGLVREGGSVPALWARSAGADTRLVALTWVDEYQAILAREPGLDAAALAGRRVGIPVRPDAVVDFQRAMALRGFEAALGLAGLGLEDVEPVELAAERSTTGWSPDRPPAGVWDLELDALRDGIVDAVYVKGSPGVAAARRPEVHEAVAFGFHPDPAVRVNNGTPRTITVAAELLERPGLVAGLLAALLTAADWAGEHGAELDRVLAAETGGDLSGVRQAYGDASLHPDLRDDWLDALDLERASLARHGLLAGDVDIRDWVDPDPLAEARELLTVTR